MDAAERRPRQARPRLPFTPEHVAAPLQYRGIQAEIAPPFRFNRERSIWLFERELAALREELEDFTLPRLSVAVSQSRIVLAPAATTPPLAAFVRAINERIAPFVAPEDAPPAPRPAFAMPLTRKLAPEEAEALAAPLARELEPILAERLQVADFALIGDPGGGRALRVIERHPLRERPSRFDARGFACTGPRLYTGLGLGAVH